MPIDETTSVDEPVDALSTESTASKRLIFKRFGIQKARPLKPKKLKSLPSALASNAQRAEAIFNRRFKDSSTSRRTSITERQPDSDPVHESSAEETGEAPPRRTTRSTGPADDWLKLPVTASVKVASGEREFLDGFVYLSIETARLFKKQKLVYFEVPHQGKLHKYFIPEAELPMISEDHPAFREECDRIEQERQKRLSKAKHMLDILKANEEAMLESDRREALRTYDVRKDLLRERMLERVEDELEEAQEELELAKQELDAIETLECLATCADSRKRKLPDDCEPQSNSELDPSIPSKQPVLGGTALGTNVMRTSEDSPSADVVSQEVATLRCDIPPSESHQQPAPESVEPKDPSPACVNGAGVSSSENGVSPKAGSGTEDEGQVCPSPGEGESVEPCEETPRKKPKLRAVDIAVTTLAIASDVHVGLREVGLVNDCDYPDIEDVITDSLYPDEQYGEDEDLIV